jgi:5-methylcytosine-specific restriction endonuclease McrA
MRVRKPPTPEQRERKRITDAIYQDTHREEILIARAAYRVAHREELRVDAAIRYAAHRDERLFYSRTYHAEHREEIRAKKAADYIEHREERIAAAADYRATHPEEIFASWTAYHAEHREERRVYSADYRAADPEHARAAAAKWSAENPLAIRAIANRRRARKRSAPGKPYTAAEFLVLCETASWQCSYCPAILDIVTVQADHIIPLSRGGSNGIENIAVSCGPCNRSKHNIPLDIWLERRRKVA